MTDGKTDAWSCYVRANRTEHFRVRTSDQVFGRDPRHNIIRMVDAALAVIQQRMGEDVGNFGRPPSGWKCKATADR